MISKQQAQVFNKLITHWILMGVVGGIKPINFLPNS